MNNKEVMAVLQATVQVAAAGTVQTTEGGQKEVQQYQASLSVELNKLLQEAMAMRWPFVPEKWQYKDLVSSEDKTNLKDIISQHLPQLLTFLKTCVLAGDSQRALSVVFLVDRFLYWTDASRTLLQIIKTLHKHYPDTPIAPQLVIRQARLSVSSGNLQKAEFILSSLINNSGATGCWVYHTDADRALVQAVCVQVRGQVLQKLGLWREAAELIWASLVGFFALPQPDKKGIGTSLGLMASILISMDEKDFRAFMSCPYIDLCFLKEREHRLLLAAEAAKMAVVYSQYTSLYVLSNVVTQGTCLLSYSFSPSCPDTKREVFLTKAKQAFEIGLLTKTEHEAVPSRQELHLFVKAAHSLAVTQKWLGSSMIAVSQAGNMCQEALMKLHAYSLANSLDSDMLGKEIMHLVGQVKTLFDIQPFSNSEECSFIPDSYRFMEEVPVRFSLDSFSNMMDRFSQYHTTVCDAFELSCNQSRSRCQGSSGVCITALRTATEMAGTECNSEDQPPFKKPKVPIRNSKEKQPDQQGNIEQHQVVHRTSASSGSPRLSPQPSRQGVCSPRLEAYAPPYAFIDAQCPTEDGEEDWQNICNQPVTSGLTNSGEVLHINGYREKPRSSSSSLSDSFNSVSSWQKISVSDLSSSLGTEDNSQKEGCSLPAREMVNMVCPTKVTEEDMLSSWTSESHSGSFMGKVKSRTDREEGSSYSSNLGSLLSWQMFGGSKDRCNEIHQDVSCGTTEELEWAVDMHCLTEASEEPEELYQHRSLGTFDVPQSNCNTERLRSSFSSLSNSLGSLSSWKKISLSDAKASVDTGSKGEKEAVAQAADGSDEWVDMSCLTEFNEEDAQSSCPEKGIGSEAMEEKRSVKNLCAQSYSEKGTIDFIKPDVHIGNLRTHDHCHSVSIANNMVPVTGRATQAALSQYGRPNSWYLPGHVPVRKSNSCKSDSSDPVIKPEDDISRKSPNHDPACPDTSTGGSFELLEDDDINEKIESRLCNKKRPNTNGNQSHVRCLKRCMMDSKIPEQICTLTQQDYKALMSGVCHEWLLQRLSNTGIFKLRKRNSVYSALLLKYAKSAGLWTSQETKVYIGDSMGKQGMQRTAFWVQILHQEELLGSYVGKDYLSEKELHYHLNDVERQMTAQYYVTEFNKRLYEKRIAMQIFFIPSEVLLILEENVVVGCMTVEPYMQGDFVKLTNNTTKVVRDYKASDYGIAFGHFTLQFSGGTEVVVDLQGWVTANGKGLTYLTDPQIHSLQAPGSRTNFGNRGIKNFLESQHGPECNDICRRLGLQRPQILGKTKDATAHNMHS